jgi:hypothetical protein
VINLTEYVQVDKQLLENIIKEVGDLRKLVDNLTTTNTAKETVRVCSVELEAEPIEPPQA